MAPPIGKATLTFATVLALAVTLAMPARADLDYAVVDPDLKELKFGAGFDGVSQWLGKRLDKVYLPRIAKTRDANERARLRARRDQELVLLKNAEIVFDGRETGLEGSLVAGEFGVGTNESLYVYKEAGQTHYFFMYNGKLWKYGRALESEAPFLARIASFQGAFGTPAGMTDEANPQGGRTLVSALWKNAGFDVRLVDRRIVYGADLFVIEDRAVAAELATKRAEVKKTGLGGVKPDVENFLLEDPDSYGAPPRQPDPPPDEKLDKKLQRAPRHNQSR